MTSTANEINLHLDSSIDWSASSDLDMEFTLVYKGTLRTRASAEEKHDIRRQFHPQLKEFWQQRLIHRFGYPISHILDGPLGAPVAKEFVPQIAKRYEVCGKQFVPLVTEELALACRLDIFFLSKGLHQRIIANADLDNRLKSLFDGLRRPDHDGEMPNWTPNADEKPFYCLLLNDSLITDIRITGDTLLDPSVTDPDTYHLLIKVETKPLRLTHKNADLV